MKKYIPWIIIVIVVIWVFSSYNGLVGKAESTEAAWAQVENVYQRRADLIPNLVNTVKGAAEFEKSTLNEVIEARAKATSINVDPSNLSPESIQKFQEAQEGLSSALSRLMVVIERYPELKATQNFSQLQAQLEGTENRIAVERRRFNEVVKKYNTSIRTFPGVVVANIFGFDRKGYFEAESGADEAPEVKF
ncbi:LemA family protein [Fulvivirga sp. 29W222]|uniref:LemA family protein n=1 Tax=Fulvivirga marina TaxID=2494733 RepID=A0A937FWB9_9BACT|nr:LemA family protein [Fulvivirga marina]MBL6446218.1 LemA family protein [Fulvivirga marina]